MGTSATRVTKPVPALRDGDRMNSREFMRRYEASPEGLRAELVNGVVFINAWPAIGREGGIVPPISGGGHGIPQSKVHFWLELYALHTPGVQASAPATLILPTGLTVPEPDALLRILPEHGGRTVLGDDDYLRGAPELLVEVAKTTAGTDLGEKLEAYQDAGVREYLVWRTRTGDLDWFRLNRRCRYVPLVPDGNGILRSESFPGLWLDPSALAEMKMPAVYTAAQAGLASPEHAAFVEKLRTAAAKRKKT